MTTNIGTELTESPSETGGLKIWILEIDRIEGGEYFDESVELTCDDNGDDRRRFHERYEHRRHRTSVPIAAAM